MATLDEPTRKMVEREIEDANNPKGMSTHDGRTRVHAMTLRRMLNIIDSNVQEIQDLKDEVESLYETERQVHGW
jgi:hypothetical protein